MSEKLTKRQQDALETKKKIVNATKKLLSQKGFEKISINEITKEAKVSTGSFYTYCRRRLRLSVFLMPILSVLYRCFHPIMQSIADANFIHRSCYGHVSKNIKKTVELSTVGWSALSV